MENQRHSEIFRLGAAVWNKWRTEHPDKRPYLTGMNLWGGEFLGVNLSRAHLMGAGLRWADFSHADFSGAHLSLANLKGACFDGADFAKANLSRTDLERASFTGANLRGANLRKCRVRIGQISEVKTLHEAEMDTELFEQVKEHCPHLLDQPAAG